MTDAIAADKATEVTEKKHPLSGFWLKWLKKRRPPSQTITLTQKTTYIFPTRYGFMLLLTAVLMMIGATNYQNNLVFIATFTLLSLGLICILVTFNNLVGIKWIIHNSDPVFEGETACFLLSAVSKKEHFSIVVGHDIAHRHVVDIIPDNESRIELKQLCRRRGIQQIEPVRCQTIFPLGFLQAWSWLFFDAHCVVYPKPIEPPLKQNSLSTTSSESSDEFIPGIEEFYGLKPYQQGDLMSRIHWKSFAREKGLQTKEFVDYVGEPDAFDFEQFAGVSVELRLSYLCFLCLEADKHGQLYGLKLPQKNIDAAKGEQHLQKCLHALALFGAK